MSLENKATLQAMHPWLGGKYKSDELLSTVLMRSLLITQTLPAGIQPTEPSDTENLRDAVDMIKRCLTVDPRERPSAKELLEDPFFDEDLILEVESFMKDLD